MLSPTESAAATAILARITELAPIASAVDLGYLANAGHQITAGWYGNAKCEYTGQDKCCGAEPTLEQGLAENTALNKAFDGVANGVTDPAEYKTPAPTPEPTKRTRRTKEQIAADEAAAKAATTAPETEAVEVTLESVEDEAQPEEATPEPEAAKEGPTYADKINSAKATFLQKSKILGETDPAKQASFKASVTKFYTDLGKARISEIPEEHIDRFISEMVNKF